MDDTHILLTVNIATLALIATYGWKISRFISRIEFKVNELWAEHKRKNRRLGNDDEEEEDVTTYS